MASIVSNNQTFPPAHPADGDLADLADLVTNGPPALHWVTAAGLIVRANRADREALGYREEEYIGRHIIEFHLDPYTLNEVLRRFADRTPVEEIEARMRHKDGSIRVILINATPVWNGTEFLYMRCLTRDVTADRQVQEELRRMRGDQEHYYRLMVERENRMIGLKREVNELAAALGRPAPYNLAFTEQPSDSGG